MQRHFPSFWAMDVVQFYPSCGTESAINAHKKEMIGLFSSLYILFQLLQLLQSKQMGVIYRTPHTFLSVFLIWSRSDDMRYRIVNLSLQKPVQDTMLYWYRCSTRERTRVCLRTTVYSWHSFGNRMFLPIDGSQVAKNYNFFFSLVPQFCLHLMLDWSPIGCEIV